MALDIGRKRTRASPSRIFSVLYLVDWATVPREVCLIMCGIMCQGRVDMIVIGH